MSPILENVVDMAAIRDSKITLGVDPLGGAGIDYWPLIAERYGLNLTVVNESVDPHVSIHDRGLGRQNSHGSLFSIRHAAADRTERQIRHCVCQRYRPRPARHRHQEQRLASAEPLSFGLHPLPCSLIAADWGKDVAVGKTVVSSSMIDRVSARLRRRLYEVPVGFKWFVEGLLAGQLGFRRRRERGLFVSPARWQRVDHGQGRNHPLPALGGNHGAPGKRSGRNLSRTHSRPGRSGLRAHRRSRHAGTKSRARELSPADIHIAELAGEKVQQILTAAPGDGNPIGGIKVIAKEWLVCRAAFGHRRHLQDLCREFSRPGPPATYSRGSADHCCGDARTERRAAAGS